MKLKLPASRTFSSLAWVDPAFAQKFSRSPIRQRPASRVCTFSTLPIPRRSKAVESKIDLAKTLFIVSSKSGSTLEPNIYKQYFFERVQQTIGNKAASHFIAITDPGSKMQGSPSETASGTSFMDCHPSAGDIPRSQISAWFLPLRWAWILPISRAHQTNGRSVCRHTSGSRKSRSDAGHDHRNAANTQGRDKITLITSPGIHDLGAWLEQLIAESTGKIGKGIIPVDREMLGAPEVYGKDRIFAYLRLAADLTPRKTQKSPRSKRPASLSFASLSPISTTLDRNSFAGRLQPQWPVPSSASTPSISRTWKPAKS